MSVARKTLKTLIGTYPHTAPLKSGMLRSERYDFSFTEIVPVWDGFKGMIRDDLYEVSEMAVVTYLLSKAYGSEIVLLPAAMIGRFQHPFAVYNGDQGPMTPADLKGKRVGVRSFTTTTGTWIRGILANDYGVDLNSIDWITFEDPHVADFRDTTTRAPEGKKIMQMLLDGELDAVLGESSNDPRVKSLFGDPVAEAQHWYARRGVVPINHLVVMRARDVKEEPEMASEVYRILAEGKRLAGPHAEPDPVPFGIEANRASLAMLAEFAFQQGLLPHRVTVDDMFAETRLLFGE